MEARPYTSGAEHLADCLERTRLLLTRQLSRHWKRATSPPSQLQDLFVSLEEASAAVQPWGGWVEEPPEGKGPEVAVVAERLLAHEAAMAARLAATGPSGLELPAENLRALLGLSLVEMDALMVLAALQLDPQLHRLATFIWADFAVKQPTLGFVAEVVATTLEARLEVHAMGRPGHPLARLRVVEAVDGDRWRSQTPLVHKPVRLHERVVAYLLGERGGLSGRADGVVREEDDVDVYCRLYDDQTPLPRAEVDARVMAVLPNVVREAHRLVATDRVASRHQGLARRVPILALGGGDLDAQCALVRSVVFSRCLLVIDLTRALLTDAPSRPVVEELLALGLREAVLQMATPIVALHELLEDSASAAPILSALERTLPGWRDLVVLSTRVVTSELRAVLGTCAEVHLMPPPPDRREVLWREALEERGLSVADEEGLEELASRYVLGPGPIGRAVDQVAHERRMRATGPRRRGEGGEGAVSVRELKAAVSSHIQHGLGYLADIHTTEMSWDDVVLPESLLERLREMVDFTRHSRRVYEQWGFGRIEGGAGGAAALFYGPPGTGKTLSAAIIARELAADLYRVDLSRIVSKWIGETEKNLARLFDEAERSRGVLLFDEADSLFAKRTSVNSSNDRNANLEVNYLLQRIERFDGVAILTSNFPESIDEAFQRRLRFRLEFPMPDGAERAEIWRKLIPSGAPLEPDIAFGKLGDRFELSPGHIKNAVLRAAFAAARDDRAIGFADLQSAASTEYREMGRIVLG